MRTVNRRLPSNRHPASRLPVTTVTQLSRLLSFDSSFFSFLQFFFSRQEALLVSKAVTRGVFWVFKHPPKFQEKIRHTKIDLLLVTKFARGVEPTVSRSAVKTVFMPSTSLEMHQNRFRPGLRPGPHWRSLQRSLRPLAGGEGARRVLPKNPTPSSALRASAIGYAVSSPNTPENKS